MNNSDREIRRQKWEAAVNEWQASGLSIKKWCKERNISDSTFQYWKERVLSDKAPHRSRFIELPQEKASRIEMECAGVKVYIDDQFDEHTLVKCLQALKKVSC